MCENSSIRNRKQIPAKILVLFQVLIVFSFPLRYYAWDFNGLTCKTDPSGSTELKNCEIQASGIFYLPTGKSEHAQNGQSEIPFKSLKNHINKFDAGLAITESLIYSSLSKFILFTIYKTVNLLSTDIIFPFHYFW